MAPGAAGEALPNAPSVHVYAATSRHETAAAGASLISQAILWRISTILVVLN
jgi:hypothetical protein